MRCDEPIGSHRRRNSAHTDVGSAIVISARNNVGPMGAGKAIALANSRRLPHMDAGRHAESHRTVRLAA
jgi:hypothetical protein